VIRPFKDIFFLLNLKKRVSQRITVESQRITSVSQAYHSVSLTPASNFDTPTFRAGATLLTVLARGSAEGAPGAATLLTVLARGSAQAVPWAVSVLTVLARGSAEAVPGAATLLTVLARGSAQGVPWAATVLTVLARGLLLKSHETVPLRITVNEVPPPSAGRGRMLGS